MTRLSQAAEKIKKLLEQGKTPEQIARELNITQGRIESTMQRYGLTIRIPEEELAKV